MAGSIIAEYAFAPTHYTMFKQRLAELQRFICPRAASAGLKLESIESIFDENDPEIAVGFRISASKVHGPRKNRSQGLLPPAEELAAVIDCAAQDSVNNEKTPEAREQKIRELTSYADNTLIDGQPHSPRPLVANDPTAPIRPPVAPAETDVITVFDIERGRLRVATQWVTLDSQVAEEFREAFRRNPVPTDVVNLKLDQTRKFLELVANTASRALHSLDNPLHDNTNAADITQ